MNRNRIAGLVTLWCAAGASIVFAQQTPPPNCPGFTNCIYTPAVESEFVGQAIRMSYTDATGMARPIEVYVRVPTIRTGRMPVVIWAHGGGDGRTAAVPDILRVPSELTANAGYITISPAFRPRTEAEQASLCAFLGSPDPACNVNSGTWDRPFDIKAIIDLLEHEDAREASPLFQRVRLDRILVGGHSAGSSGTISVAGGYRFIAGNVYGGPDFFEDSRPIGFIALSPSAPGYSSNFDTTFQNDFHTWSYINRPMLFLSGSGDCNEQPPHGRRISFEKVPGGAGNKFRGWFEDVMFSHGHFGDDPCEVEGERTKCAVFTTTWGSFILAFADAYARERPAAMEYLKNGYGTRIPRGLFEVEWSVK